MKRRVIVAVQAFFGLSVLAGAAEGQKISALTSGFFMHESGGEAQVVLQNLGPKPSDGTTPPSCDVNIIVIDEAGDTVSQTPTSVAAQQGRITEVSLPPAGGAVGIGRVDVEYTKSKACSAKTLGGVVYPHPMNDPNAGLAGRKYELQVRAASRAQ